MIAHEYCWYLVLRTATHHVSPTYTASLERSGPDLLCIDQS